MKIQPLIPRLKQNNEQHKSNVEFTGAYEAFTTGLRFLETNQAWGANAVDLCSMVIPRTSVDFINRGPAAGIETGRREASGTINHSLVGVYGTIAGVALTSALNKNYGIKAYKIFADDETLEILGKAWDKQIKAGNPEPLNKYLTEVFSSTETRIGDEWKSIPADKVKDIVNKYSDALTAKDAPITISKNLKSYVKSVIMHCTGSENSFRLVEGQKPTSITNILDNVYNVSRTFVNKNKNIEAAFGKDIAQNPYIARLKHMNRNRSLLGLGIASAVGMSIQPINIYLTKKKTGSDGFVGVEGRQRDNSSGFKAMKAAAAALFGSGVLTSIGIEGGLNGLLKKIQFRGLVPTMEQFKLIYGITIMSRFIVARDNDELREAVVKDTLGFFNWLVLGNFVAKTTANSLNQTLLNYSEKEHGKGFFNKIIKAPMTTRDELLHKALNAAGINSVENGKALSFNQMLKKLSSPQVSEAIRRETRGKLWALSFAQLAGYLYSGLVLGVGIPKLNIYMTNKSEARRKARIAAENQHYPADTEQHGLMLKPENMEFLKKYDSKL